MSPALCVGLVGTGFIGAVHARSIARAGGELAAVCASSPQRSQEAAARLGAGRAFDKAHELVTSPDLDVVHIAAPNAMHAELTLAALQAGKHVVCEKPLAASAADADEMRRVAQDRELLGAVPFVNRFHPMVREARAQLARGEHGAIRTVHGSYLQDWMLDPLVTNWRVDEQRGGPSRAFADIGSHWVDLAEWITGERIVELVADTSVVVPQRPVGDHSSFTPPHSAATEGVVSVDHAQRRVNTEDVATVLFRLSGGATGSVVVSQVAAGRKNRLWIEVDASHGSVVFDQENAEQLWVGEARGGRALVREPAELSAAARRYAILPAGHAQGFQDCFDAFVGDVYASIAHGHEIEGLPTFADGARSARVVEAVLASADQHSWIEV